MAISVKNAFCLTIISILLKRDVTSYNIYYDRVPIFKMSCSLFARHLEIDVQLQELRDTLFLDINTENLEVRV